VTALDATALLLGWRDGDGRAADRLFELLYGDLRDLAHRQLASEREGHTLHTTDLVHEAYLRLVDHRRAEWEDRARFLGIASSVMRRVLIDYARRHAAEKRGGARMAVSLSFADDGDGTPSADQRAESFLVLDDALDRLAAVDERLARVVECRFFGGLTDLETAAALGIAERTVRRDWLKAKAWLAHALHG
jgi:RNA polymerase sigma factor (TIGR02999 family)